MPNINPSAAAKRAMQERLSAHRRLCAVKAKLVCSRIGNNRYRVFYIDRQTGHELRTIAAETFTLLIGCGLPAPEAVKRDGRWETKK